MEVRVISSKAIKSVPGLTMMSLPTLIITNQYITKMMIYWSGSPDFYSILQWSFWLTLQVCTEEDGFVQNLLCSSFASGGLWRLRHSTYAPCSWRISHISVFEKRLPISINRSALIHLCLLTRKIAFNFPMPDGCLYRSKSAFKYSLFYNT